MVRAGARFEFQIETGGSRALRVTRRRETVPHHDGLETRKERRRSNLRGNETTITRNCNNYTNQ